MTSTFAHVLPSVHFVATLVLVLVIGFTAPAPVAAAARQSDLKLVVIEGEDAVNIVSMRTAVASIVEVRDRNDNPVGGATVVFLLRGRNTATFANGARQITLTTDAVGRAMANAVTPVSNGPVQIQVTASFQGQTATSTITQTNFTTVADAARAGRMVGNSGSSAGTSGSTAGSSAGAGAGAATAGGVAAGAGGGMSALAIGGIVAGVGAGAGGYYAVKAKSGSSDCTYALSPETQAVAASGSSSRR